MSEPKIGQAVHYVMEPTGGYGKRHLDATIKEIDPLTQFKEKRSCTLFLDGLGPIKSVPMALSREAGTWHPIGGYGC